MRLKLWVLGVDPICSRFDCVLLLNLFQALCIPWEFCWVTLDDPVHLHLFFFLILRLEWNLSPVPWFFLWFLLILHGFSYVGVKFLYFLWLILVVGLNFIIVSAYIVPLFTHFGLHFLFWNLVVLYSKSLLTTCYYLQDSLLS